MLVISTLSLLAGCGEHQESAYVDVAAAEADGAMIRGWIPRWIPETSVEIREAHDLDTNRGALALRFSPRESWNAPPTCKPASRIEFAQATKPSFLVAT